MWDGGALCPPGEYNVTDVRQVDPDAPGNFRTELTPQRAVAICPGKEADMWKAFAALVVCGCGSVDEPPPVDHGAPRDAGAQVECRKPWAGVAPSACATSDDCFWSQCSESACVGGACVHVKRPDGEACVAPELGAVGECHECLCTIET